MNKSLKLPRLGSTSLHCPKDERLLLLCFYDPLSISTVPETVRYIQSLSNFNINVINLFDDRIDTSSVVLRKNIDFNFYQTIIIHNSLSYNVDALKPLDDQLKEKLKTFQGVKILMKQDENHRFKEMAKYIGETGFDLILTCLPKESISKIYPKEIVGSVAFSRMLTGYVTPSLRLLNYLNKKRPIDIGYRGSIQPLSFGRLAYEKRLIGEDVSRIVSTKNLLNLDISSKWEDRKGGNDWFDFLLKSKATLGAESGASVFDVNGDLDERCRKLEEKLGAFNESKDYAESFLSGINHLENKVHYNQISPRHFEAIATGTVQLLYPGQYSNILKPGKHYFELKRDYSNINEAINYICDDKKRVRMAKVAYEEIILNKDYWIETFVKDLDNKITKLIRKKIKKNEQIKVTSEKHNILMLFTHDLHQDPRIKWVQDGSYKNMKIHLLGIHPKNEPIQKLYKGNSQLNISVTTEYWSPFDFAHLSKLVGTDASGLDALSVLAKLDNTLSLTDKALYDVFGAPLNHERNNEFKGYLAYMLHKTITLLYGALNFRGLNSIIACDLDTLPAALILKSIFKIPIFYDAHEYWPTSQPQFIQYEIQFWKDIEKRLLQHVDNCQTVTPGLAEIMSSEYGVPFNFTPNCVPIKNFKPFKKNESKDKCKFLYQGGFSPYRGIELLINIWGHTNKKAILYLRGPEGAFKTQMQNLALEKGLLNKRIFFPKPVKENHLIEVASKSDVGIAPYTPKGINYSNCCPNKISQYMAAGLPLLCNKTNYIQEVIKKSGTGLVVDFNDNDKLINAINELTINRLLRENFATKSLEYFKRDFNWEVVSKKMYETINNSIKSKKMRSLYFFKNQQKIKLLQRNEYLNSSYLDLKNEKIQAELMMEMHKKNSEMYQKMYEQNEARIINRIIKIPVDFKNLRNAIFQFSFSKIPFLKTSFFIKYSYYARTILNKYLKVIPKNYYSALRNVITKFF